LAQQARPAAASEEGDIGWFPLELELEVGEQKVLSAELVRSYSEGKRGVVDVRLTRDAKRFVVVGAAPGVTTLLFLLTDGTEKHMRIQVHDPNGRGLGSAGQEAVERRDNVRLDFYFVQLEKGYNHRIGVGTPDSIAAGFQASFDLARNSLQGATAVVEDQALLRLDMAQAAGWAKLMRQAAVITQNGAKARFSGGGEVNIPVQGSLTTGIHRISFGSSIEVLPRYDALSGRIEIGLRADVSDLSDDRGTGTPGRTVSELETVVNLRLGQAVVLGGLSASSEIHTRSGLPLLSQIPLLGVLFGSDRVTRQDTENVVFIVPSVVDAVHADARQYIREALDAYRNYDGDREDLGSFAEKKRANLSPTAPSAGLEGPRGAPSESQEGR
jgi:pilus assembly protein CpaC